MPKKAKSNARVVTVTTTEMLPDQRRVTLVAVEAERRGLQQLAMTLKERKQSTIQRINAQIAAYQAELDAVQTIGSDLDK